MLTRDYSGNIPVVGRASAAARSVCMWIQRLHGKVRSQPEHQLLGLLLALLLKVPDSGNNVVGIPTLWI